MMRLYRLIAILVTGLVLFAWAAPAEARPWALRHTGARAETVIEPGQTVQDVIVVGGNVTIRGRVKKDVVVLGGDVSIDTGAEIGGAVAVIGGRLEIKPGAAIREEILHLDLSVVDYGRVTSLISILVLLSVGRMAAAALLILLTWGLSAAIPRALDAAAETLASYPYKSVASGAATLVLILLAASLMLVTIFLIPVALALLLAGVIAAALGFAVTSRVAGDALSFTRYWSRTNAAAAGATALTALAFLPVAGSLAFFISSAAGVGAFLVRYFGARSSAA